MTQTACLDNTGFHPPGRMPAVLAGTLALGLGFYLFLGALFIHCGIIDLAAGVRLALRRLP